MEAPKSVSMLLTAQGPGSFSALSLPLAMRDWASVVFCVPAKLCKPRRPDR